ncbi:MAG: aminotransferase [Halobacteriovoraceae bacterium]|nr:aminotransferase [Halobacteriovoraceae bacterium]
MKLAERAQKTPEYYFSKKLKEVASLREQGRDIINLGIGSPDHPTSEKVIQGLIDSVKSPSSHGYAPYGGLPSLKSAIKNWHAKHFGTELNEQTQILPLAGSKEGIVLLSLAFLNPGDEVLVPDPGYPAYGSIANMIGANVVKYDLTSDNHWLPDFSQLENLVGENTKLMWINYPHMPTGTDAGEETFKELLKFAKKHNIFLCNDNPYSLVGNSKKHVSILLSDTDQSNCAELNSLSKCLNMAGWRVGMLLGSPELIEAVTRIKTNMDSGMFIPIQEGAIEALKLDDIWYEENNKLYATRRDLAFKICDLLDLSYEDDQVGMFVWAKVKNDEMEVANIVDDLLYKAGVFLTPGFIFGKNGERHIRISLCASEEKLIEAYDRIKEVVK